MDLHKKINKTFLKIPLLILSFCICFTFFNLDVFALGKGNKPATEVSNSETTKDTPNSTLGKREEGSCGGGGNNSYTAWYEVTKNESGGDMVEFVAKDKYGNVYRGNEAVNRTQKAILKWRNDRRNRVEEDRTLRLLQSKEWQIPDGVVTGKAGSQSQGRVSNGKCLAKIQSAVWVKRNGDSR